jgi:heat shock protein HslJ
MIFKYQEISISRMRKFLVSLVFFVIAAVMIAGCTTSQPAPAPVPATMPPTAVVTTPAPPLMPPELAGNWILTTIALYGAGSITYPTTDISLNFQADGTLTGYDGCNNYYATYIPTGMTTPKGKGMTISDISMSKKYCATLAEQETTYINVLGKVMAYNVNGNQLSMTATTGDVLIYQTPLSLVTPVQFPHPA